MKKFLLYGFIILLVFNLLSRLWTSITLDEDEEVSMFIQKVEMLESSDDYYHISNTSNKYLNFLEENIDWFSSEQSKEISEKLNSLKRSAKSKIDSIDQSRAEIKMQEEEEKRVKKEKEERLKKEEEERLKREKEMAWMEKYWHVGSWDYEVEGLYLRIDLRQNGTCDVYFVDGWIYDLTYKKTSTKIILSPIGNTNLEFIIDNKKRSIYTSGNATRMNRRIND